MKRKDVEAEETTSAPAGFVANEPVKFNTGESIVEAVITAVHDDGTYDVQEIATRKDHESPVWYQRVAASQLQPR